MDFWTKCVLIVSFPSLPPPTTLDPSFQVLQSLCLLHVPCVLLCLSFLVTYFSPFLISFQVLKDLLTITSVLWGYAFVYHKPGSAYERECVASVFMSLVISLNIDLPKSQASFTLCRWKPWKSKGWLLQHRQFGSLSAKEPWTGLIDPRTYSSYS